MADLTGKIIAGRYRMDGTLGAGGMAVVYKAYDTRLETEVALKVIDIENLPPKMLERALKRFEREAKALARLTHPNIVKVTDYGEYQGRPYLVMSYLPGGTLKKKLGRPIPWPEAVELILPIAEALAYAHSEHTIHRDVKPSNIILTRSGRPLLTDFGIAKMLDLEDTVDLTGTSASMGTPEYMAPEQARAKSVDQRADIYSLGIVLYEMATGRKPFVADTPMDVLIKQATEPLPSPKKFVPTLPDYAEAILRKALAKKLEDRYQTMEELYTALKASAAIIGKQAKPVEVPRPRKEQHDTLPWPEPPRREPIISLPRSMPTWVWGVIGVAVVLVCIVLGNGLFNMILPLSAPQPTQTSEVWQTSEVSTPTAEVSPTFTALPTSTPFPTETPAFVASTWTRPADGMVMIFVPAGKFNMGSDKNGDAKPIHYITLDSYWMDLTEVTNKMYALCVQAGTCRPPKQTRSNARSDYYGNSDYDDFPVIYVDWNMARNYCEWTGVRLPTEAEWEKAARGTDGRTYPWGEGIDCNKVNYSGCVGDTTAVGSYPYGKSPYGLLDMGGNVWEWVADWYDSNYYSISPSSNPQGPFSGKYRVLRGGSWADFYSGINSAYRFGFDPSLIYDLIGFRCARSQ